MSVNLGDKTAANVIDWSVLAGFGVLVATFYAPIAVLGLWLPRLSCRGQLPAWMEWITFSGGCTIHADRLRDDLWIVTLTAVLVDVLVPVYTVIKVRRTLPENSWSTEKMFATEPFLSTVSFTAAYVAIETSLALTFTSLSMLALVISAVVYFVVAQFAQGYANSLWLPRTDTKVLWRELPHMFLPIHIARDTMAAIDNASDIGTALVLNPDRVIGTVYWIFSLVSFIHHVATLSMAVSPFRLQVLAAPEILNKSKETESAKVLPAEEATQSALIEHAITPDQAKEALRRWTLWKLGGTIFAEIPLLILDVILLSRNRLEFFIPGAAANTVIIVGAIVKGISLLVHISMIVFNIHILCN